MRSLAIILLLVAMPASTRADEFDSLCSYPVQTVFASIAAPLNFDEFSAYDYETSIQTYDAPAVCTSGTCAVASVAPTVVYGSDAAMSSNGASEPVRAFRGDGPIRRILARLRPRNLLMRIRSRRGCR